MKGTNSDKVIRKMDELSKVLGISGGKSVVDKID